MAQGDDGRLETIKNALTQHDRWLRHKGGKRADLSFQDFSGVNLSGANLTGAKLAGASFVRARLRGVNFSNADLFGADLEQADLSGANLTGADMRGANMSRCTLTDANMRGADFRPGELAESENHAKIGGVTSLAEAKMERSILAGAYLSGCDLSGADLVDADLSGAELTQSIMIGVDLSGANLQGATLRDTVADLEALRRAMIGELPADALAEPSYRVLTAEQFLSLAEAHHLWTRSEGKEGKRLDLDLALAPAADIPGMSLVGARLRRCRFDGGDWRGVDLQMADLSYSSFLGVDMTGANAQGANFRRASLRGAKLVNAKCDAFPLAGGRRWPTNFDGVDLSLADIHGAVLTDAVFSHTLSPQETAQERRRYARYAYPAMRFAIGDKRYACVNWSLGGLSLDGEGFRIGERLSGELTLADAPDFAARADVEVVYHNRSKRLFSVRFDGLGQDLKILLKRAFALSQA